MDKSGPRVISAALVLMALPSAPLSAAGKPAVLAEFPVEPYANLILLPVRVGGKERGFLLDTGSTLSLFDSSLSSGAPQAVVRVSPPAGASIEKGLYAAPEATLGGLDMRESGPVMYHDFSALRAVSDRDVWGLIGMQFLKSFVVQVDLDAGKVRLLDPKTPSAADWGSPVPMRINRRGIPVVTATVVNEGPVEFELDTGDNGGGNLTRAVFERLFPRRRAARGKDLLFTGVASLASGRARKVTIGGLKFTGLLFESANISSLGLAVARRSVLTFDFPRGALYVKKGRRFGEVEAADMSGIHVIRREGRITAMAIDSGSPAQDAGMLSGDVVAAVPGHPEAERDMAALRRLLSSGDGKRVALTILREGRAIPVELRLRKLL